MCVLEARDLPVRDSCVKLKLGKKFKSKSTRVLRNTCSPIWNEEFVFRVHEEDVLVVTVVNRSDEISSRVVVINKGTRVDSLVGEVRIPVGSVAFEDKQTLPPTWFSLHSPKSGRFFNKYCGLFCFPLINYLSYWVTSIG